MESIELPDDFFNHDAQQGGFYPGAHVGIDIENFGTRQNILIEGIRGTGKTHILRMMEKYNLDNFEATGVLPIYVSLAQTNVFIKDVERFRINLYANIVRRCIETIETYKEFLQPNMTLRKKAINNLKNLFGFQTEVTLDEILVKIKDLSETLLFQLQFDLSGQSYKELKSKSTGKKSSAALSAGIDVSNIELKTNLSSEENSTNQTQSEKQLTYVGSQLVHHDAANYLIEFLRQVQVILDLEYSVILLDECSEASFEAQVEVFRLFKTIRGSRSALPNRDVCTFFVGTVYPQGETYYPTRLVDGFSFEPGQDCTMEFLQWDETDLRSYLEFFENMLLLRASDRLQYYGLFKGFSELLFDDVDTFQLAALCAHGIPRRFWEILKRAYDRNSGIIRQEAIIDAVHEITNNQILRVPPLTDDDIYLVEKLGNLLYGHNTNIRGRNNKNQIDIPQSIYFTVSPSKRDVLRKLIMQGAVHDKSRMRTKSRSRRPKPVYTYDMSLSFTNSVIPRKYFTHILIRDIPRCAQNDFQQASDMRDEILQSIIQRTDEIDRLPEENGIIKQFVQDKFGTIWSELRSVEVFFYWSQVKLEDRDTLKKGDKVSFRLRETDNRYQALELEILEGGKIVSEDGQRIYGFVVAFRPERGFGFIQLLDSGPDVFFHIYQLEQSIRDNLQIGDYVEFDLHKNERGRLAKRITRRYDETRNI